MPTEVLHGLYDGGHGAGLEDLWSRMLQNPLAVGAFLWALADEGIVRTDRDGALDTDGNHAPDGIVGPYREKEASFFTIKEVWSPVFLELGRLDRLPPTFDGRLRVENRYDFTDLGAGLLRVAARALPGPRQPAAGGPRRRRAGQSCPRRAVAPGDRGTLDLALPADWRDSDALYLTARDPQGREIHTWTWMTKGPEDVRRRVVSSGGRASGQESERPGRAGGGRHPRGDRPRHGPARLGRARRPARLPRERAADRRGQGEPHLTRAPSRRRRLRRRGGLRGQPQAGPLAAGRQRLARAVLPLREPGPPRAPRRHLRLPGGAGHRPALARPRPLPRLEEPHPGRPLSTSGRRPYNDTRTGADWTYPEFKGHHADLYWAVLETKELPITVVTDTEDLFLRVFTPRSGVDPQFTAVAFPDGDLSFLHGIAPIGTKFAGPKPSAPRASRTRPSATTRCSTWAATRPGSSSTSAMGGRRRNETEGGAAPNRVAARQSDRRTRRVALYLPRGVGRVETGRAGGSRGPRHSRRAAPPSARAPCAARSSVPRPRRPRRGAPPSHPRR